MACLPRARESLVSGTLSPGKSMKRSMIALLPRSRTPAESNIIFCDWTIISFQPLLRMLIGRLQ